MIFQHRYLMYSTAFSRSSVDVSSLSGGFLLDGGFKFYLPRHRRDSVHSLAVRT